MFHSVNYRGGQSTLYLAEITDAPKSAAFRCAQYYILTTSIEKNCICDMNFV